MTDHERPCALVLGMSVNGLSVARSLGRKGIWVIALERGKPSATIYSRYVKEVVCVEKEISDQELLDCLLNIGRSYWSPIFLYPTSDFFVLFVSRNRDALGQFFSFTLAEEKLIEAMINKQLLHELATSHGVSCPKTFCSPRVCDAEAIVKEVGLPCFIKPVYSHIWRENYEGDKVILAENKEELSSKLSEMKALGVEVVVQEIIPGADDAYYAVMIFMDGEKRPLAVFTKQKLRQYPMGAGEGSLQIAIQDKNLEEIAIRFLQGVSYVGPCELEFKRDERDGQYKLIEINPRTVTWQELVTLAGIDIPYISYQYTINKEATPVTGYRTGMRWLCFEWDFQAFLQARRMKMITFFQWLHSMVNVKSFAYFSWDDPLPFFVQTTRFLSRSLSYVLRKFLRKRVLEKHEKPWAVVLGFSINGLSAARSLGRKGIRVIAVSRGKTFGAAYCRYVKELIRADVKISDQELLDRLLNIGKSHPNSIFLFPTDDFFVLFVSRNREVLRRYFSFTLSEPAVIESVVNKRLVYQLAASHGMPFPKTFFSPRLQDAEAIAKEIGFPCFIKPVYSHLWRDKYRDDKVFYIKDREALLSRLSEDEALGLEVVVQEIIPGEDDAMFCTTAFMDAHGKPLVVCSYRKLRQSPIGAGVGSLQITIQDKHLEEMSVRFLRSISYVGNAEFEFKWDSRDRLYKFIEINARTIFGQEMLSQAGVDIPYMSYEYTMHRRLIPAKKYRIGMKWLCFESDFEAFLQARRMKIITFLKWLRSLAGVKAFAYFCWDDPAPFFFQMRDFLSRTVSYLIKKAFRIPASVGGNHEHP